MLSSYISAEFTTFDPLRHCTEAPRFAQWPSDRVGIKEAVRLRGAAFARQPKCHFWGGF
jgi:hypothetical protein